MLSNVLTFVSLRIVTAENLNEDQSSAHEYIIWRLSCVVFAQSNQPMSRFDSKSLRSCSRYTGADLEAPARGRSPLIQWTFTLTSITAGSAYLSCRSFLWVPESASAPRVLFREYMPASVSRCRVSIQMDCHFNSNRWQASICCHISRGKAPYSSARLSIYHSLSWADRPPGAFQSLSF